MHSCGHWEAWGSLGCRPQRPQQAFVPLNMKEQPDPNMEQLSIPVLSPHSFIAVENMDNYCVLISSKAVYFLKSGDYVDREAIFLEVKYDDLYHCLVSKDHGKVYVQVTKKAANSSSGVSIPGPSHQKPMVSTSALCHSHGQAHSASRFTLRTPVGCLHRSHSAGSPGCSLRLSLRYPTTSW